MEKAESLVFDRTVEYYDKTRSLSPETMAALVPMLVTQLGAGPCLEIGVGTGRIALPLLEARVEIMGLDLSAPMLARLIENAGSRVLPLVVGDATALPFGMSSFGAALAVHVLHLIPDWKRVVHELARVVVAGGRVLIDVGHHFKGPYEPIQRYFAEQAGVPARHRGANKPEEVDEVMAEMGATVRRMPEIIETRTSTYSRTIKALEDGLFSFTWPASEEDRRRAGEATREWAAKHHGDLDQSYEFGLVVALHAYDLA